ncbi:hypothetical protein KY289_016563 [Solanum tuberosum]|nr:hypothetical protein KY289_016563 [Solanum tuberosum]
MEGDTYRAGESNRQINPIKPRCQLSLALIFGDTLTKKWSNPLKKIKCHKELHLWQHLNLLLVLLSHLISNALFVDVKDYIDEILSLMRERQLRYPEHYDSTDRIMDLNFYTNFKQMYDSISEEATRVGGKSFTQLLNEFVWNGDMIDYIRGIIPYPGGINWIGAKRILAVMNMNNTHFVTLEILLHEGRMNVYDCNLTCTEHDEFLTFIQHVFDLLSILLRQSGIMKHLLDKLLNEPWKFEGLLKPMVKISTCVACGSYSLAFIEHLITNTPIQPPNTLLCDNTVGRLQWNLVAGIIDKNLKP